VVGTAVGQQLHSGAWQLAAGLAAILEFDRQGCVDRCAVFGSSGGNTWTSRISGVQGRTEAAWPLRADK